jgi:hypothetical protein
LPNAVSSITPTALWLLFLPFSLTSWNRFLGNFPVAD